MAEKNDNDNIPLQKDTAVNSSEEDKNVNSLEDLNFGFQCQSSEQILNGSSVNQHESTPKKEENPFSFKKFLNQDSNQLKNQNVRRRNYSPENLQPFTESSSEKSNHPSNSISSTSKIINTNEMASVLPDFVQDHLVVEQCYLNGASSKINVDNLNLQNFPDLNLEHRHPVFNVKSSAHLNAFNHHSSNAGINLPDFTLSAGQCHTESEENFCNKGLPDFTVNTSDRVSGTPEKVDDDEFFLLNKRDCAIQRKTVQGNCGMSESSPSHRSRVQISLSPSVPLDLPSYDGAEFLSVPSGNLDQPIPFDLTIAADDRNGSTRGIPSTETVSKSLPDFLSDGPIQNDRLGENLQHGNLVTPLLNNENQRILSSESTSNRLDEDEYQREIQMLKRQLFDKNRRIHILESKIENLQTRERKDASGLEYALIQVERNLKQSVRRASNAETALVKLQQENSHLRMELASLRSKNANLQLDDSAEDTSSNVRNKSQRIAKELRAAANSAENSLRSLLTGIDNLRVIAASVESINICKEKTEEVEDLDYEDSASGPAL